MPPALVATLAGLLAPQEIFQRGTSSFLGRFAEATKRLLNIKLPRGQAPNNPHFFPVDEPFHGNMCSIPGLTVSSSKQRTLLEEADLVLFDYPYTAAPNLGGLDLIPPP